MTGENPLIAQRVDSTTAYSGIGIVESVMDLRSGVESGSWIEGTIGAVGTGLETLGLALDPVGTLLSYGVAWLMEHVKPLSDALDWLAGDPDQISAFAQTWRNVGGAATGAGTSLTESLNQVQAWTGVAAQAYRSHAQGQSEQLAAAGEGAQTTASIVQGAGVLVGAVREIVRDLVAECVATLIARIPQWLAEIGGTLGIATPHVVASAAALIAKWVNRIGEFLTALTRSLNNLMPLIRQLDDVFGGVSDALRRGPSGGPGTPNSPGSPGTAPSTTPISSPDTGTPTATPGSVTPGQSGPGASTVSTTPTASPGTTPAATGSQSAPTSVAPTPTASPGTTAPGAPGGPSGPAVSPTPGTTPGPARGPGGGAPTAPTRATPSPSAAPGASTSPSSTSPASTAPASAAPTAPSATSPTAPSTPGGTTPGGTTPGGTTPGGTTPGGTTPGGDGPGGPPRGDGPGAGVPDGPDAPRFGRESFGERGSFDEQYQRILDDLGLDRAEHDRLRLTPADELTDAELRQVAEVRDRLDAPPGTVMTKVLNDATLERYLGGGEVPDWFSRDGVSGFVARGEDVADVNTPQGLRDGLALDDGGAGWSPVPEGAESAYQLRFEAPPGDEMPIAYGGRTPESEARVGEVLGVPTAREGDPFVGTGYTAGGLPEWRANGAPFGERAEIWRVDREGNEVLVGVYSPDGGWRALVPESEWRP